MTRRLLPALLVLPVLSACATTAAATILAPMRQAEPPALNAPEDKARLIVFRGQFDGAFQTAPHVLVDDAFVGVSFMNTQFKVDLEPGIHTFCVGPGPSVAAKVISGRTYFLKVGREYGEPLKRDTAPFREALAELKKLPGAELQQAVEATPSAIEIHQQLEDCAARDKAISMEVREAQQMLPEDSIAAGAQSP